MSVMDDMLAWLRDVLDETQRTALRTLADTDDTGQWCTDDVNTVWRGPDPTSDDSIVVEARGWPDSDLARDTARHVVLHDPQAALARVAAERAILAADAPDYMVGGDYDGWHEARMEAARWLAWGHRHDAPGFLDEWTPSGAWTAAL